MHYLKHVSLIVFLGFLSPQARSMKNNINHYICLLNWCITRDNYLSVPEYGFKFLEENFKNISPEDLTTLKETI